MLIGLSGPKNSGKDHIYGVIKEQYPFAERLAFADVLKEFMSEAFGFTYDEIERLKRAEDYYTLAKIDEEFTYFTMRETLQRVGMAVRNILGEHIWIDAVLPSDMDHSDKLYVVTDIRMNNEARRVKELDGVIWKVKRHDIRTGSDHITEMGILPELADYYVQNDTEEGLNEQVKELLNECYVNV